MALFDVIFLFWPKKPLKLFIVAIFGYFWFVWNWILIWYILTGIFALRIYFLFAFYFIKIHYEFSKILVKIDINLFAYWFVRLFC